MRALVVFESIFGNTRTVAEAIAEGLSSHMVVELRSADEAPVALAEEVGLLVVGGPTHAFGLTRARTREDAAQRSHGLSDPGDTERTGLREWLAELSAPAEPVAVATFDTRIDRRVPGSAARGAARRLRRRGYEVIASPESFWVRDVAGPLVDGEVERARAWGLRLAATVGAGDWISRSDEQRHVGTVVAAGRRRSPPRSQPSDGERC